MAEFSDSSDARDLSEEQLDQEPLGIKRPLGIPLLQPKFITPLGAKPLGMLKSDPFDGIANYQSISQQFQDFPISNGSEPEIVPVQQSTSINSVDGNFSIVEPEVAQAKVLANEAIESQSNGQTLEVSQIESSIVQSEQLEPQASSGLNEVFSIQQKADVSESNNQLEDTALQSDIYTIQDELQVSGNFVESQTKPIQQFVEPDSDTIELSELLQAEQSQVIDPIQQLVEPDSDTIELSELLQAEQSQVIDPIQQFVKPDSDTIELPELLQTDQFTAADAQNSESTRELQVPSQPIQQAVESVNDLESENFIEPTKVDSIQQKVDSIQLQALTDETVQLPVAETVSESFSAGDLTFQDNAQTLNQPIQQFSEVADTELSQSEPAALSLESNTIQQKADPIEQSLEATGFEKLGAIAPLPENSIQQKANSDSSQAWISDAEILSTEQIDLSQPSIEEFSQPDILPAVTLPIEPELSTSGTETNSINVAFDQGIKKTEAPAPSGTETLPVQRSTPPKPTLGQSLKQSFQSLTQRFQQSLFSNKVDQNREAIASTPDATNLDNQPIQQFAQADTIENLDEIESQVDQIIEQPLEQSSIDSQVSSDFVDIQSSESVNIPATPVQAFSVEQPLEQPPIDLQIDLECTDSQAPESIPSFEPPVQAFSTVEQPIEQTLVDSQISLESVDVQPSENSSIPEPPIQAFSTVEQPIEQTLVDSQISLESVDVQSSENSSIPELPVQAFSTEQLLEQAPINSQIGSDFTGGQTLESIPIPETPIQAASTLPNIETIISENPVLETNEEFQEATYFETATEESPVQRYVEPAISESLVSEVIGVQPQENGSTNGSLSESSVADHEILPNSAVIQQFENTDHDAVANLKQDNEIEQLSSTIASQTTTITSQSFFAETPVQQSSARQIDTQTEQSDSTDLSSEVSNIQADSINTIEPPIQRSTISPNSDATKPSAQSDNSFSVSSDITTIQRSTLSEQILESTSESIDNDSIATPNSIPFQSEQNVNFEPVQAFSSIDSNPETAAQDSVPNLTIENAIAQFKIEANAERSDNTIADSHISEITDELKLLDGNSQILPEVTIQRSVPNSSVQLDINEAIKPSPELSSFQTPIQASSKEESDISPEFERDIQQVEDLQSAADAVSNVLNQTILPIQQAQDSPSIEQRLDQVISNSSQPLAIPEQAPESTSEETNSISESLPKIETSNLLPLQTKQIDSFEFVQIDQGISPETEVTELLNDSGSLPSEISAQDSFSDTFSNPLQAKTIESDPAANLESIDTFNSQEAIQRSTNTLQFAETITEPTSKEKTS
ncbi:hypothetical protein ACQ4M3_27450, partial [Leptolyngbya sp. AN03gr2]|uniref:hypothetical protein n=1 Tax=Leptolyngbya sp. AN03gr2 TaxID=3423364 RepID=UPI003D31BD26